MKKKANKRRDCRAQFLYGVPGICGGCEQGVPRCPGMESVDNNLFSSSNVTFYTENSIDTNLYFTTDTIVIYNKRRETKMKRKRKMRQKKNSSCLQVDTVGRVKKKKTYCGIVSKLF